MGPNILQYPDTNLRERLKGVRLGLCLAALGFLPLVWDFFILSWKRPAYQFYPMALFAAGLLAWRGARQAGVATASGSPSVTRILGGATLALWLAANVLWSPWLGFLALLLGLAAILWHLGGRPMVLAFAPAGLILLAIVPPPLGLDER